MRGARTASLGGWAGGACFYQKTWGIKEVQYKRIENERGRKIEALEHQRKCDED